MMKKQTKVKVVTILGTRPEIIRLSRVIPLLDKYTDHVLVHTGQNYDYELNEIFYQDLDLRKPDHYLEVDTSSLGMVLGETLMKSEKILLKEKPDAILILGDTNSSVAAIIGKRLKIPIYHMEAGNRCFDQNVPEEINRKIIDHVADFNLVYTEHARRNLIAEGISAKRIYLTGSPMFEVLTHYERKINNSKVLSDLNLLPGEYFLVSSHREENVDHKENLQRILEILSAIADGYDKEVIVSTHPRTRKRIEELDGKRMDKRIKFLKPFGFTDYVNLQKNAICTLSDSGTISEESAILSFPAVTLRNSMERPEALDAGTIILTGFDKTGVLESIRTTISEHQSTTYDQIPGDYCVKNTSWRVLKLILGTSKLSHIWDGIMTK